MKRTVLIVLVLLVGASLALAETISLTTPEVLSVPTAPKMQWKTVTINATDKVLTVTYYWLDATGNPIQVRDTPFIERTWTCRDIETPGINAECMGVETPWLCCTGVGTGTCDGMQDTCFTDTFTFIIRTQDVGKKIGVGLRDLIWNKMRASVLSAGNTGTFE